MSGNISTLSHHVYFWLNNPDSISDREKLIEGVAGLRRIETIRGFHIGVPAATEDRDVIDNSYSVSLLAFFDSEADEQTYQVHPTHLKFIEDYGYLWRKVVVYDSLQIEGKQ